jgi:hypothetical protein
MPRLSSTPLFAGALLAFSLFTGCKQGIGERCEVASDCASNFCNPGGGSPNSICCDPNNTVTCMIPGLGTGGSTGSGGAGGSDASADVPADVPADGADTGVNPG